MRVVLTARPNTHMVVSEIEVLAKVPGTGTGAAASGITVDGAPLAGLISRGTRQRCGRAREDDVAADRRGRAVPDHHRSGHHRTRDRHGPAEGGHRRVAGLAFYYRNWPAEHQYFVQRTFGAKMTPDDVYAADYISALGAIDSGVTCVLDWSFGPALCR